MKNKYRGLTIVRVAVCLFAVACVCTAEPKQNAESSEIEKAKTTKVKKAVYLIHSLIYEGLEKNDPETLQANNYQIYRDREKMCETYWKQAIDELESDAIYVQLYGGASILEYAKKTLGDHRVITPRAKFDPDKAIANYHDLLAESFQEQLKDKGLQMDIETAEWELWGESFEGCVHTYGGGMASSLGLKQAPFINFSMTVPDARFLCTAKLLESFVVDGSDVRAFIFDGPQGYPIAIFLPGFRPESDAPDRYASLALDRTKVTVVNKNEITLYSKLRLQRPGREIPIKPDRDHEGIIGTDHGLQIRIGEDWYILGRMVGTAEFLSAVREAKITTLDTVD